MHERKSQKNATIITCDGFVFQREVPWIFSEAGMELGMECGGMDLSRGVGMGVGHGAWRQGVYGVGPGAWRHGVVQIDQSIEGLGDQKKAMDPEGKTGLF